MLGERPVNRFGYGAMQLAAKVSSALRAIARKRSPSFAKRLKAASTTSTPATSMART